MLRIVGKVTSPQRKVKGMGARAVIFLMLGVVTLLLALDTWWLQGMLNPGARAGPPISPTQI